MAISETNSSSTREPNFAAWHLPRQGDHSVRHWAVELSSFLMLIDYRGLQVYDLTTRARRQRADTCPTKLPLPVGGLDQWLGNAKTAEPIEMPVRGPTHARLRSHVLVGWAHWCNMVNAIWTFSCTN